MKAMLIIQTANGGYALAPYMRDVPADFVEHMQVAGELKSFSYGTDNVSAILKGFFESSKPTHDVAPASIEDEPL